MTKTERRKALKKMSPEERKEHRKKWRAEQKAANRIIRKKKQAERLANAPQKGRK